MTTTGPLSDADKTDLVVTRIANFSRYSSWSQAILQSSAVVFGLTIGFVAPEVNNLSNLRLTFLVAAIVLLPIAIVASLWSMAQWDTEVMTLQAYGAENFKEPRGMPLMIAALALVLGIACLSVFATIEVVQLNNDSHTSRTRTTTTVKP